MLKLLINNNYILEKSYKKVYLKREESMIDKMYFFN